MTERDKFLPPRNQVDSLKRIAYQDGPTREELREWGNELINWIENFPSKESPSGIHLLRRYLPHRDRISMRRSVWMATWDTLEKTLIGTAREKMAGRYKSSK